jgi:hypothetical protein
MVPKSGTRLPKSPVLLSDARVAELIGTALQEELGASRRAAKTVIAWTGVSDHTARSWLNGRTSPSALHLIVLATHCRPVMMAVLRLSGHDRVAVTIDLEAVEARMEATLEVVRSLLSEGR